MPLSSILHEQPHLIQASAGFLMAAGLLLSLPKLRGTTMVAPCLWALFSTLAISVGVVVMGQAVTDPANAPLWQSTLRYVTACTSFLPMMAVLGAKRPQDGPWQWIVLSLGVVLALPALQANLLPAGPRLELFAAWKIFLVGLMCLGLLNWLPTKFWPACCCFTAGQLALSWEFLADTPASWATIGSGLMLVAIVIAHVISGRAQTAYRPESRTPILNHHPEGDAAQDRLPQANRRWLDFRDCYGSFWSLRLLQRVNQTAEICQWPVRLQWWGFEGVASGDAHPLLPEHLTQIHRTLDTLLRRFL